MDSLCIRCKGKGLCGKPCKILSKFISSIPKPTIHFSGKSAPEVFVGRKGYPNVDSGILAPAENDNLANFSTAEQWSKSNFSVENILRLRSQLIYGRTISNIRSGSHLTKISQELALSSKPVSTEIFLKKKPRFDLSVDSVFQPMMNRAPINKAVLEENPFVLKKVDYIAADNEVKATDAICELSKVTSVEHIQKILSIGLLGIKNSRKMVPTRWSITATDDIVSKNLLEKIRGYNELNEVLLFSGNFVGNYMEILFLPGKFSFEAIEAWLAGNVYSSSTSFTADYEGFNGRKTYAENVTGGYYAMRLPVTEYLDKEKKQATVIVFREVRPEYYAPLGVGIVRECARRALASKAKHFSSKEEAFEDIKSRLKISFEDAKKKSWVLENYGKQKSLKNWF